MQKEKTKLAVPQQKFVVRFIGNHPLRFMKVKGVWAAVVTNPEKETVFASFDEAQDRAREILPWGQFTVRAHQPAEISKNKNGGKKNEQKK